MTYTITKDFAFSASHQLEGLREGHPCGRLHGHNYRVRVWLEGEDLSDVGFLFDYGDLAPIKRYIDDELDHRHLNDRLEGNPTAERLAQMLGRVVGEVIPLPDELSVSIGVSETPKTWAWWGE